MFQNYIYITPVRKRLYVYWQKNERLKRTRAKNDVQLAFSYFHYLNEQENFNKTVLDGNRNGFKWPIFTNKILALKISHLRYGLYAYVNDNIFHVRNLLNQIFRPSWLFETKSAGFWLCINDGMDPDHPGIGLHAWNCTEKVSGMWYAAFGLKAFANQWKIIWKFDHFFMNGTKHFIRSHLNLRKIIKWFKMRQNMIGHHFTITKEIRLFTLVIS